MTGTPLRDSTGLERFPEHQDQRKYARRNEGSLGVSLKRRGLLSELFKGEKVEWLNFNRFGFAFASATRYEVCDELCVTLKIQALQATGLIAVIHNARIQAGRYRYGVQFYFGANGYMRSAEVRELLLRIEASLS